MSVSASASKANSMAIAPGLGLDAFEAVRAGVAEEDRAFVGAVQVHGPGELGGAVVADHQARAVRADVLVVGLPRAEEDLQAGVDVLAPARGLGRVLEPPGRLTVPRLAVLGVLDAMQALP